MTYDYIILGCGASGLMMANEMAQDSFFENKQILIIDKEIKNKNDRTWSFWEKENIELQKIAFKNWKQIEVKSNSTHLNPDISPYTYYTIRSKDFYEFSIQRLKKLPNFHFEYDEFLNFKEIDNLISINTLKSSYKTKKLINSIPSKIDYKTDKTYPCLYQHFLGWFIQTKDPVFDNQIAKLMDFNIEQKNSTRFMYLLPFSKTEALIEFTLFSKEILSEDEYELEIKKYLEKYNIHDYKIIDKEKGIIPMTCYNFQKSNTNNIINIGTAGGWTKPSTGYTFSPSYKKAKELKNFIKTGKPFSEFHRKTKFWYYDLLLLDVLSKHNEKGAELFTTLFKKNNPSLVFKFLDEKTNFWEDLKIMYSFPSIPFVKAIFKRILGN